MGRGSRTGKKCDLVHPTVYGHRTLAQSKKKQKTLETNPLRGPKHLLLPALLTGGLSFLLAVLWSASSLRTVL